MFEQVPMTDLGEKLEQKENLAASSLMRLYCQTFLATSTNLAESKNPLHVYIVSMESSV